ncbi:hypothetical protein FRB96_008913 [Tulasnella sp. 330]|nr:hypothetical protein FRB96_008913 [Tulasnella sp. 330]
MSALITIHGVNFSTCVQAVKAVAYEKDLDVNVIACDLFGGEQKSAAWLEIQPFGKVPYLDEDGFMLYESRAISRYLATKYAHQGTKLLPDPTDHRAMALAEQFLNVEVCDFYPSAIGIGGEAIFTPMRGGKPDAVVLEKHRSDFKAKLEGFERIFAKQDYLGGKEIGLADLLCLPYGTLVEKVYPELLNDPTKPNFNRWWKAISVRPSWKRVLEESK